MSVKINSLEFENVKRVKAVRIEPTAQRIEGHRPEGAERRTAASQ